MQTPFSASVSPAEKRALFSAGETRAEKASTNKAREKNFVVMLITRVPCVFDMTFSLYLQPRINIIQSKLESSKKRTSERNAEYKSSDAERQRRFNWSY